MSVKAVTSLYYEVQKCGMTIQCRSCGWEGEADLVTSRDKKKEHMKVIRCEACKSLNVKTIGAILSDEMTWEQDEWKRCYPSQWKGLIVPEAMAHPAKFSNKLIRRIYEHMLEEGWLKQGDAVVDPFGGVALGALDAMRLGLEWTGVELEAKFVELGNWNISNWEAKFHGMPHWGRARLLDGDSRRLGEIIGGQQSAALSSPPYKNETEGGGLNVNRPPTFRGVLKDGNLSMGDSEGNLGGMDDRNFEASITSPPFRQSEGGTPEPKPGGVIDERLYARHAAGNSAADGYGKSAGQLANMKTSEESFQGTVSSPPYEDSLDRGFVDAGERVDLARRQNISNAEFISPIDMEKIGKRNQEYGNTDGQLGADSGDDFWMAAREIVEQVYAVLKPGGHAAWVVKDFVRGGERVEFSDQWRQLCEAVGFVTLHEHRAMLVHSKGTSLTLEGGMVEHKTESKSFFRRIAEKKGSPRIDWETVWCMEKPA